MDVSGTNSLCTGPDYSLSVRYLKNCGVKSFLLFSDPFYWDSHELITFWILLIHF